MIQTLRKIFVNRLFLPIFCFVFLLFLLLIDNGFVIPELLTVPCLFFVVFCCLNNFGRSINCLLFLSCFNILQCDLFNVSWYSFLTLLIIIIYGTKYINSVLKKKQTINVLILMISLIIGLLSLINFDIKNINVLFNLWAWMALLYLAFIHIAEINFGEVVNSLILGIVFTTILGHIYLQSYENLERFYAYKYEQRFQGLTENPNILQGIVLIAFSCSMVRYFKKKLTLYEFLIIFVLLSVVGIMTKSKMFLLLWAILILALVVFGFLQIKNKKNKLLFVCACFLFCGIVFVVFRGQISDILTRFVVYKYDNIVDKILTGRWSLWGDYLSAWSRDGISILFGYGYTSQRIFKLNCHNSFVEVLYLMGFAGFICIFSLLFIYFKKFNDGKKISIINMIPFTTYIIMSCIESLIIGNFVLLLLSYVFLYEDSDKNKHFKNLRRIL